jgi:Putative Actinobacterial Holin-X, holin superfamily III
VAWSSRFCSDALPAEPDEPQNLAQAITEISERASLLVREEIELAKAEITAKLTKLVTGAIVALAAGFFVLGALYFSLHGLAWLAWYELFPRSEIFWGYFTVAGGLLLLGALAGLVAARALHRGSPPTPAMAIDEARKIRDAVGSKGADGE